MASESRLRRAALSGLLLLSASCGDGGPTEPAEPSRLLGRPLGYRGPVHDLTWVPGTRLVAFRTPQTDSTACGLRTLDVDAGTTRLLDGDCTRMPFFLGTTLRGIVAPPSGGVLVYQLGVATPTPFGSVLRTVSPFGGPPVELRRASLLWAALAVSRDGNLIAFSSSSAESLFVWDRAAASVRHVGTGRPVAFSPEGRELLFQNGAFDLRKVHLATGDEAPVAQGLVFLDLPGPYVWDDGGIWVFVDRFDAGYWVRNLTAGTSARVIEFGVARFVRDVNWVPDGRRVAFWEDLCRADAPNTACTVRESSLYLVDRVSGARSLLARTQSPAGPIAFSPDYRSVVYGADGELFLASVP